MPLFQVNMTQAREAIVAAFNADTPVMTEGDPGIGKSATFQSIADELKIGLIDFRLTMRDIADVGGIRVPDVKTGLLRHYVPSDLPDPRRHGPRGIMLFEEINTVPMMMQTTAYGIIQERRIGEWQMPEGWVPMATGNSVKNKAGAQSMSTALANRFLWLRIGAHLDSWIEQYGAKNVDFRGLAFLRFRENLFHVMPATPDDVAFPSARSWTKAFKFLDLKPALRFVMVAGCVGQAAATELEGFLKILESMVTIEDIIRDPKGTAVPTEPSVCYAVCGMMSRAMTRKNSDAVMIYAARMKPEYQVVAMADAVRRDNDLKTTSAFSKWAVANQGVML